MSTHGAGPIVIPDSTHVTMVMRAKGAAAVASAIDDFLRDAPKHQAHAALAACRMKFWQPTHAWARIAP
jgi:hypothetical protein